MIYSEFPLPAATAHWALCLWRFALEPHDPPSVTHIIPPDGSVTLSLTLLPGGGAHAALLGPSPRALVIEVRQGQSTAGVRLYPGAAPALLGMGGDMLVGALLPAPAHGELGPLFKALERLAADPEARDDAAKAFAELCKGKSLPDPAVADAVAQLMRAPDAPVASPLGERQLRRRFKAGTGLSPKSFSQIQRLREACIAALANPVSRWAEVAADAGFADQAHFCRAVAKTFGVTPTALFDHIGRIRHEFTAAAS